MPAVTRNNPRSPVHRVASARRLALLELVTGSLAVIGGALLVAAPGGSLLAADPAVLADTPFHSWRIPGLLLVMLVGGGFLAAAAVVRHGGPLAYFASTAAGAGLVAFELAELLWLGFQPLELLFAAVGVAVIVLAARSVS